MKLSVKSLLIVAIALLTNGFHNILHQIKHLPKSNTILNQIYGNNIDISPLNNNKILKRMIRKGNINEGNLQLMIRLSVPKFQCSRRLSSHQRQSRNIVFIIR